MSTVDFNTLIYTASKSLKNPSAVIPEESNDLNHILQEKALQTVQHKAVFKQDLSIKAWFFNVFNKTVFGQEMNTVAANADISFAGAENGDLNEIHHVVNKMDSSMMTPFIMHFQGFKYEEIAQELNLPIEIIQERIEAARLSLVNEIGN